MGEGTVVVADDILEVRETMCRLLAREGYVVHAAEDGIAALECVQREAPDLVISDVLMPRLNGFDLCRRMKGGTTTRLIPVVLVTGLGQVDDRIEGINAGADDFLTKPFNEQELKARVKALVRLKRQTDELDSAESMILSLARTVEARDHCTGDHCERMSRYASAFGVGLGLPHDQITALHRGGILHDIGKVAVPDAILLKPGPLTPDEHEVIKRHTTVGDDLCGNLRLLRLVRPIIRHHHERLNGSGYPDGLKGNAIPLLAQMTGIVDVYDALTSDRPYRRALSSDEAIAVLEEEVRRGWRRSDLLDEFVALLQKGGSSCRC